MVQAIMDVKNNWREQFFGSQGVVPCSFVYGGVTFRDCLSQLTCEREVKSIDDERTEILVRYMDHATGLQIDCRAVDYVHHPVLEWVVYLKNTGPENTPIIERLQGLDVEFRTSTGTGEYVLNGNKGEWCVPESYAPYREVLQPGTQKHFAPRMGKSTGGADGWPYYNLQMPGREGVIMGVGWPGQWASTFARDDTACLTVTIGQERTRLYLKPGEEIRTPLIVLLFWQGDDPVEAQNSWRRWFWVYNTPLTEGKRPEPLTHIQVGNNENDLWNATHAFLDSGITPDVCWRDANWYPSQGGPFTGGEEWINTGTWEVDPMKFPNGFRAYSDWIRTKGMKFLLWFEPERVGHPNSYLAVHHPEWLMEGPESCGPIFNLGNPDGLQWLIDHIDGLIKREGIDWYREDMNGPGPLPAWRRQDEEDREGLTENLYVQGHLAFWDELIRRNSGLRIDSCASGGRRNDLETLRRAVPLLRSDYQFPPDLFPQHKQHHVDDVQHGHTYGLSSWIPYYGSAAFGVNLYRSRSFYMPAFCVYPAMEGWERDEQVRAVVKQSYEECREIAPLMLGDYYPLTAYSLAADAWMAWQFNRPEHGDGVIQAFRHRESEQTTQVFRLRGLDSNGCYEVVDFDNDSIGLYEGETLMQEGLPIHMAHRPQAVIMKYQRREQ